MRVVCARAYHALFMRNMLIRPSRKELEHFHPDYVIYNAGAFPANRFTTGMTSSTSVAINFAEKEMVILGTEYAGEMKKVRTISDAGAEHCAAAYGASNIAPAHYHVLDTNQSIRESSPCSTTRCRSSTTS